RTCWRLLRTAKVNAKSGSLSTAGPRSVQIPAPRPLNLPRQHLLELLRGHGLRVQESLGVIATQLAQELELLGRLDPLGNGNQVEGGSESDDAGDERAAGRILRQAADKRPVDLQQIDR